MLIGSVQKIAPVGTSSGGVSTYDVWLSFDAAGTGVRPGMNASGQVQVAHVEDALYIPVEALMTINNQYYVMVADGGTSGGFSLYDQGVPVGGAAQSFSQPMSDAGGQTFQRGEGGQGGFPMAENRTGGQNAARRQEALTGGGATVAAVQSGSMRAVTVGIMNDDHAQILSGLSAGEVVLYQNVSNSTQSNPFAVRTNMAMPMMGF